MPNYTFFYNVSSNKFIELLIEHDDPKTDKKYYLSKSSKFF